MSMTKLRRNNAFRAISNGDLAALVKAVKNRVEANWREYDIPTANTLLEYACELANIPAAEWLVDQGADINAYCIKVPENVIVISTDGLSRGTSFLGPLTTAIYFKQPTSLGFLLARGVNLDLPWDEIGGRVRSCREMLAEWPELTSAAERFCLEICTPSSNKVPSHPSKRL